MNPILLEYDGFVVPAYGVLYLLAFLAAIFTMAALGRQSGIPFGRTVDIGFLLAISGEAGSRLLFVLVEFDRFREGTITLSQFLVGGRVQMGGFIAATLFCIWYTRRRNVFLPNLLDAAFAGAALGIGIGRLGCLMGGCCFGNPTDLPWGITFHDPVARQLNGTVLDTPLHPTQLLQSVNGFVLFALLLFLHSRRRFSGQVTGVFFIYLGITRFLVEFLRGDPRGGLAGLATSQWIGLAFAVAGAAWLTFTSRRYRGLQGGLPEIPVEREWQFEADDLEFVRSWLLTQPYRPDLEVLEIAEKHLRDTYLDTSGNHVYRAGFALRIRRKGEACEATLKATAGGEGDLRARQEFNEPLTDDRPQSIAAAEGPVGSRVREISGGREIAPFLDLETRRSVLHLAAGDKVLAEIALDRTTFGGVEDPQTSGITRVEVELMEADEKTLLPRVQRLRESCGLRPTRTSKLEAGLRAVGVQPRSDS